MIQLDVYSSLNIMSLIEQINPNISRFTDQHFYGEEVGTYLIDLPDKVVLFDLPAYSAELERYLKSLRKPLVCFLSHGPCGIADGTIWQAKVDMKVYLHAADSHDVWLAMKPDALYTTLPDIAEDMELIHTPGHTPGSVCLLDQETKTLFSGDTFGGVTDGEVWDFFGGDGNGDLPQRLESCRALLSYDFDTALPFHYDMILQGAHASLQRFVDSH